LDEVLRVSEELETPIGKFKVLSVDALIQAKKAMDRPHDRLTITQLQAIKDRRSH
jgi:predicted Mrr-cat superfamily restriction endonuclease